MRGASLVVRPAVGRGSRARKKSSKEKAGESPGGAVGNVDKRASVYVRQRGEREREGDMGEVSKAWETQIFFLECGVQGSAEFEAQ